MNTLNKKNGYAILFTLVVISIIASIAIGVSNSVYKQMVLSSLAHDSQIAFYTADTAAECALYMSESSSILGGLSSLINPPGSGHYDCGVNDNGSPFDISVSLSSPNIYYLQTPQVAGSCFKITVDKNSPPGTITEVRGYNTCALSDLRQVERGIRVEY